jgi:hypothetical protein
MNGNIPAQNEKREWPRRGYCLHFIMLLLLPLLLGSPLKTRAQSREYTLKAAFLFHFTQFVDWPAKAFAETNSPFVIGVYGTDPFGKALTEVVEGERVKGRTIVVEHFKSISEALQKKPHILFISSSESQNINKVVKALEDRPILTVADVDRFASRGGMIRFITENNKIRFRINNVAAQSAGLNISSKLLRLAEVVSPDQ